MSRLHKERQGKDFELNIIPVLDSLVVLISFLLLSATFANFALLDATVPTVIQQAIEQSHKEREKFRVTVTVENKAITLSVDRDGKVEKSIVPLNGGVHDTKRLHAMLVDLKRKHPDRFSLDLDIKNDMSYGEITKIMDESRNMWKEDGSVVLQDAKTQQTQKTTLLFPDIVLTGIGS